MKIYQEMLIFCSSKGNRFFQERHCFSWVMAILNCDDDHHEVIEMIDHEENVTWIFLIEETGIYMELIKFHTIK